MNGHALQNRIVFLQLNSIGRIFAVLGGDVAARSGHAGCFVLGTLENNLNSIAFFCHCDQERMVMRPFSWASFRQA